MVDSFGQSWRQYGIGVLGLVVLLGVLFQWIRHGQDKSRRKQWFWQQAAWSLVCVVLILVHVNLHINNILALLAFLFLIAFAGVSFAIALLYDTMTPTAPGGTKGEVLSHSQSKQQLWEQLFILHALSSSTCLVFSVAHILAVFYY